jgi:hypothetical protein
MQRSSRVQRTSRVQCSVAPKGPDSRVAQQGVAISLGYSVTRLVLHQLVLKQAGVLFSARHPMEGLLAERKSDEQNQKCRNAGEKVRLA